MLGLDARAEAAAAAFVMEETSAAVLPRREIFLSRRVVSGRFGSLNGGFRRPSLEIMSFWLEVGTERLLSIDSDRSLIVAEGGKDSVCGVP